MMAEHTLIFGAVFGSNIGYIFSFTGTGFCCRLQVLCFTFEPGRIRASLI
jgi:hypothetical protein